MLYLGNKDGADDEDEGAGDGSISISSGSNQMLLLLLQLLATSARHIVISGFLSLIAKI